MTGAERQAVYHRRREERRARDAIEGLRYVQELEVKLRQAEARQAPPGIEAKLRQATERARAAESRSATKDRELQAANQRIRELEGRISALEIEILILSSKRGRRSSSAPKKKRRSSSVLTKKDENRMASLLGMLGSDHAGERENAALAVEKLRRKLNLSWPDIIGGF